MQNDTTIPGMEEGIQLLESLRPYVRDCGNAPRPAWKIEERKLLDYLLVYIAEGCGRFVVAGKPWEARQDDLFWIPPDTPHTMEGFVPGMLCPYVHFDLMYRPLHSHWAFSIPGGTRDLSDFATLMHPPVRAPLVAGLGGRIRHYNNRRVGRLIQDICSETARQQPYTGLRTSGLLMEILAEILRGQTSASGVQGAHVRRLEGVADYMLQHCGEALSIESLARGNRMSPSHFRQLFQLHFGVSPRAWLRRARIRKARDLIINTPLNFSEIASQVGFETVHSFSRAFRALEGMSPRAYRKHVAASGNKS